MDKVLKNHLDVFIQDTYDDDDCLIVIYGDEGAGKSVLESQIQEHITKKTNIPFKIRKNIHFHGDKLIESALNGIPRQINCLDESRRTLSKMRTISSVQENFMNFLSECRSNNQFNLVVLPSYFDLNEDVATRRSKLVIKVIKRRHPVTKRLQRGFFQVVNTRSKVKLKKFYKSKAEEIPPSLIVHQGKFTKEMGWDEEEYKQFKEEEKRDNFLEKEVEEEKHTFTDKQLLEMVQMSKMPNPHKQGDNPKRYQMYEKTKQQIRSRAMKVLDKQERFDRVLSS